MVRHIIATNADIKLKDEDYFISQEEFAQRYLKGYKGKKPVYFASTVSPENYSGFLPYLQLEGLVYRVVGDSVPYPYNIDIQKTEELFYRSYRYTGLFPASSQSFLSRILDAYEKRKKAGEFYDFSLMKDVNTRRPYSNYAAGLFHLGLAQRERMNIEATMDAWHFALLFEPTEKYPFLYNLGLLYAQLGMVDSAEAYFSKIDIQDAELMTRIGMLYRSVGNVDQALEYLQKSVAIDPKYPQAYVGMYYAYLDKNDTAAAARAIEILSQMYPHDTTLMNMLRDLKVQ
jgi:tetratricopeptide (TPR) repeat protein